MRNVQPTVRSFLLLLAAIFYTLAYATTVMADANFCLFP